MTQAQKIYDYMQAHGSITRTQSFYHCGCINLPCRIFDLKKLGHRIKTDKIAVRKKNGDTAYVARYKLEEDDGE